MEDFKLYFRFKEGDQGAFEELYEKYAPPLYRYLFRLLLNEDDSKDVLQETFLRLFRSSLEVKGKLSSWLFKVATNLAYRRLVSVKATVSLDDCDESVLSQLPYQVERSTIEKALRSLPEQQRAVVMLKFFEGFRYKEIAEILECPVGTVKSRMYHAIMKLREFLKEREGNHG